MFMFASQVWSSLLIPVKFNLGKLRNCYRQGILDSLQPRFLGSFLCPRNLFKEIPSVWIVLPPNGPLRLSDELRNNMEIVNRGEEFSYVPKLPIDIHLLQISLGPSLRVCFVICIRTAENFQTIFYYTLTPNKRTPEIILGEAQLVATSLRFSFAGNFDTNDDIRVLPCRKTANCRNPATFLDRLLNSTRA